MSMKRKVILMGAAGRDFHNFNVLYRDKEDVEVVAFTAAQIPDIANRRYPAALAGKCYPKGIPIEPEEKLAALVRDESVDDVLFSYSDVSHEDVMHRASLVVASGASFCFPGARQTMLESRKPVVAVCAVRTGAGKSQTTRRVCELLKGRGKKVVVVRHPMPYGKLEDQRLQRFALYTDLDKHRCTIEEREEYEPHLAASTVVYAGVDYHAILEQAEEEADVILWDGGNNDTPFFRPSLHIVLADPHRAGHELTYHPGETNLHLADVVVINKQETASWQNIETVRENVRKVNPEALIIDAASPIAMDGGDAVRGSRVLVVEDGPTLTHGEMTYGAGVVAARKFGARELVDPRPFVVGTLADTFARYPFIGTLLPAMGYSGQQVRDLEETINRTDCDAVLVATPVDLSRLATIEKPCFRVRYELQELGRPNLEDVLQGLL